MQNFYELENLIEKKKLEEGINDRVVGTGGKTSSDYIPSIGKGLRWKASDGFGGGGAENNPELVDQGKDLDKELVDQGWDQAVVDNPALAFYAKARDAQTQQDQADRDAQAGIGIQSLAGRRGGKGGDVIRTSQNDVRTALGEMATPESINALKIHTALFQPRFFGKTLALPELFKAIKIITKLGTEQIKPALSLLRQTAGNQIRVFDGDPWPKMQIVDPHSLGGAGSAPEAPDVDPEDLTTATGGAQYATPLNPKDQLRDQLRGRSGAIRDPGGQLRGGRQNLATQKSSKWEELKIRANKAVMDEVPDPKEIRHLIDDLNNHVNDLKSTATENPDAKAEIEEADGFIKAFEEMTPQREWFEIFESMCRSGI